MKLNRISTVNYSDRIKNNLENKMDKMAQDITESDKDIIVEKAGYVLKAQTLNPISKELENETEYNMISDTGSSYDKTPSRIKETLFANVCGDTDSRFNVQINTDRTIEFTADYPNGGRVKSIINNNGEIETIILTNDNNVHEFKDVEYINSYRRDYNENKIYINPITKELAYPEPIPVNETIMFNNDFIPIRKEDEEGNVIEEFNK